MLYLISLAVEGEPSRYKKLFAQIKLEGKKSV